MINLSSFLTGIAVWAIPLVFAVTLHEAAHGYAAWLLGDDTAKRMGRISLNPLRHVDPFGTIILPLLLLVVGGGMFGWAKPVPVNFSRLRNPRWGMVAVAAAGPATNLMLAVIAVLLLHVLPVIPEAERTWVVRNIFNFLFLNVLLAVFNMIPIPPLDGGRVLVGVLPRPLGWRLSRIEPLGMLLIILALFVLPSAGRAVGFNLDLFGWLMNAPVDWIARTMVMAFGPL